jgi:hypothetical protein
MPSRQTTRPLIDSSEWAAKNAGAARPRRGAAGEDRFGERAGELRLERGRDAAPQVAKQALEDAEVGVASRLQRNRLVLQAEMAVELELGALARESESADLEDFLVERELDRPSFARSRTA